MPYIKLGDLLTVNGLDTSSPAEFIDPKNTPECQNVEVNRNVIKKRTGTTQMGLTLSEEVMAGLEFIRETTRYNIRVGLDKIEEWDDTNTTWNDVTGSALTGTTNDPICLTTMLLSGKRIAIITNFVDNIRKYTGTGNTADLGGTPPQAKFAVGYGDYLVLAHINDTTKFPMRVQWCDTADPETWTGGNSGSKDLIEDGKDITGLAVFGNYVAVHKETAIYLGYLVDTSAVFRFDRKPTGSGTICNATIQNLPTGEQIFLANDGLRLFNGISTPLIESPILDDLREGVNPEYVHKSWSVLVEEKDEYWLGVPIGSQTTGDTVFKYNYRTGKCYKDTRSKITAAWTYTEGAQPAWDDQTLTWDTITGRWDDKTIANLFQRVILSNNAGITVELNSTVNNDNASTIDGYWQSKDFTVLDFTKDASTAGHLMQWVGLEIWAKGNTLDVEYSIDEGQTWNSKTTLTLDTDNYPSDDAPQMYYIDVISTKIRFRFRNNVSSEMFYLKQFTVQARLREHRSR